MTTPLKNLPEVSESGKALTEHSNGSVSPAPLPSHTIPKKRRRRSRLWVFLGVLCLLATGTGVAWRFAPNSESDKDIIWSPVTVKNIQLTITERGEVQSANNVDITCQVKIGKTSRGPTIRWIMNPGTIVRKGEELLKLEDSAFQKELLDQEIVLKKAQNEYQQAIDHLEIVKSQAEADLRVAQLAIETADIDLERYNEGEYKKLLKDVESRLLLAKSTVERWEERVAFVRRMVRKNFNSQAQLDSELYSLHSAQVALSTVEEELRVLTKYDNKLNRKQKESAVAQTKSDLARIKIQGKAQENQAINDRDTKEAVYKQELAKYNEINTEIEHCTIRAPKDGLVVYYESERSRRSSESEKVEVGSTVYEGQKLMQIPDLENMEVVTRVHEALILNVKGEKYRRTGFGEALQFSLLTNPTLQGQLLGLMSYPALRQSPDFSWIKERDRIKTFDGLRADIIVDALPGTVLAGRVKTVNTVATKSWYSEVRTYDTVVEITGDVKGLKPGMSARVKIYTEKRADNVLSVPVQAVFQQFSENTLQHFVYVKGPKGPERRPIEIGIHDDRYVEVKKGLAEGDMIAENPMDLHEGEGEMSLHGKQPGKKGVPAGKGQSGK